MDEVIKWWDKYLVSVVFDPEKIPPNFDSFLAGWECRNDYEKEQLAKSLAEFDNDNNDCGSGGCIL